MTSPHYHVSDHGKNENYDAEDDALYILIYPCGTGSFGFKAFNVRNAGLRIIIYAAAANEKPVCVHTKRRTGDKCYKVFVTFYCKLRGIISFSNACLLPSVKYIAASFPIQGKKKAPHRAHEKTLLTVRSVFLDERYAQLVTIYNMYSCYAE